MTYTTYPLNAYLVLTQKITVVGKLNIAITRTEKMMLIDIKVFYKIGVTYSLHFFFVKSIFWD